MADKPSQNHCVLFTDVTLRDGLQAEAKILSLEEKCALFDAIAATSVDRIEATSFVSPKWIPQFQDADSFSEKLFERLPQASHSRMMAFVPNARGLERLLKYPYGWVSAFIAVSATFNKKNINQTPEETLVELKAVVYAGKKAGRKVRLYISTSFGCPYEGAVPLDSVIQLARKVAALGPDEIAFGDTIGVALPSQVTSLVDKLADIFPKSNTALHFHNTYGLALACIEAGVAPGIRHVDAAFGGVGGCPYAKGATGNVALEDVWFALSREGKAPAFEKDRVMEILKVLEMQLGPRMKSHLFEVWHKGGAWYGLG